MEKETFEEGIIVLSGAIIVAAVIIFVGLVISRPKINGYDLIRAAERNANIIADGPAIVECLRQNKSFLKYSNRCS